MRQPPPLTAEEVRRVAHLARLLPDDAEVERYRTQLASIIAHVAQLAELDVQSVEPMTHLGSASLAANRIEQDDPSPPLGIEALALNAPAMEGRLLAVPKVIGDARETG